MTEVTGKLHFTYIHYYTVDEKGLPSVSNYDGDKDIQIDSYCCKSMEKFDNYHKTKLHRYSEFTSEKLDWYINLEMSGYDYDVEVDVPDCPWCHCKPTISERGKIKKVKLCKERIIPEKREMYCEVVDSINE